MVERSYGRSKPQSTRERLALEIGHEIAAWQTSVQRFDELAAAELGVSVTDLQVLGVLAMRGALPAGQLAEGVGLSPAAATAAIDRLERAGWVRRGRDAQDRRRVVVTMTARAARVNDTIHGPLAREGMAKLRSFTIEQLELLRGFVRWCRELQEKHIERLPRRRS